MEMLNGKFMLSNQRERERNPVIKPVPHAAVCVVRSDGSLDP